MIGFGSSTAMSPLANQSSSPRSPKSPSTLDKNNAAVTEYLASNPSFCSLFAQATMNVGSKDPDICKDAKETIKQITALAVARSKHKAEGVTHENLWKFSFDDERPAKKIKTSKEVDASKDDASNEDASLERAATGITINDTGMSNEPATEPYASSADVPDHSPGSYKQAEHTTYSFYSYASCRSYFYLQPYRGDIRAIFFSWGDSTSPVTFGE